MSIKLFGSEGLILFSLTRAVSYMLSGNFSIYSEQKIIPSKIKDELIKQRDNKLIYFTKQYAPDQQVIWINIIIRL